ncbi:MAG: FRG domain-containing protein [Methanoregula sp.]
MTEWDNFFNKISDEMTRLCNDEDCKRPFFRGLSNRDDILIPTLFQTKNNIDSPLDIEKNVYTEFISHSAVLHSKEFSLKNSWDILYEMRHHGLPTRLLDWTENFAVALFFALNRNPDNPCIWILNPIELNRKSIKIDGIVDATKSDFDYYSIFIETNPDKKKYQPFKNPISIYPIRSHPRLLAQNGVFTVHGTEIKPLNKFYRGCLKRFDIPKSAIPDAYRFLTMANINDFTLFPDLDGLSRYLKKRHNL